MVSSPKSDPISRRLLTRLMIGCTTLVVGVAAYFSDQIVRNSTLEILQQKVFWDGRRKT